MPILSFQNRNKFKNKAAIELVFKKSSNYKLPPGYHSMDICLVGGGASGITAVGYYFSGWGGSDDGSSEAGDKTDYLSPGGPGGYVLNLYNKEINFKDFYVQIGNGGYCSPYDVPYFRWEKKETRKNGKTTSSFSTYDPHFIGGGEKTFLRINENGINKTLYEALGGGSWYGNYRVGVGNNLEYPKNFRFVGDLMKKTTSGGGGNLGGGALIYGPYSYHFGYEYYFRNDNFNGLTTGEPIKNKNYPGYQKLNTVFNQVQMNFTNYSTFDGTLIEVNDGDKFETRHGSINIATGNKNISLEGYGETRIFTDGDYLAGGGACFGSPYSQLQENADSIVYGNDHGGGKSGQIHKYTGNNYSIISNPESGKPNTGGGGAGGLFYVYRERETTKARLICPNGAGGSGLCVIRCYPDEKRPKVNFIEGINKYIIQ